MSEYRNRSKSLDETDEYNYDYDDDEEFSWDQWRGVDLGESFVFYHLLLESGLLKVLESIELDKEDLESFLALLFFGCITRFGRYPREWWWADGTSLLFPKADLHRDNIKALLEKLSDRGLQMNFFKQWNKWVKEHYPEEKILLFGSSVKNEPDYERMGPAAFFSSFLSPHYSHAFCQMLMAMGEKTGLPLFFAKSQDYSLEKEEIFKAFDDLDSLSLPISYAVLVSIGSWDEVFEIFYTEKHKPIFPFTNRFSGGSFALRDEIKKHEAELDKPDNHFSYNYFGYMAYTLEKPLEMDQNKAWLTLIIEQAPLLEHYNEMKSVGYIEEGKPPGWICEVENGLEYQNCYGFLESRKHTPASLLKRYGNPRFLASLNFIQDCLYRSQVKRLNDGLFFACCLCACLEAFFSLKFKEAGLHNLKTRAALHCFLARVDKKTVWPNPPRDYCQKVFDNLGITLPDRFRLNKDYRLIYPPRTRKKRSTDKEK